MQVENKVTNIQTRPDFHPMLFCICFLFVLYFSSTIALCLCYASHSPFIVSALANLWFWRGWFWQGNVQNAALNWLIIRITLKLLKNVSKLKKHKQHCNDSLLPSQPERLDFWLQSDLPLPSHILRCVVISTWFSDCCRHITGTSSFTQRL